MGIMIGSIAVVVGGALCYLFLNKVIDKNTTRGVFQIDLIASALSIITPLLFRLAGHPFEPTSEFAFMLIGIFMSIRAIVGLIYAKYKINQVTKKEVRVFSPFR
jgi:hypothetical protein